MGYGLLGVMLVLKASVLARFTWPFSTFLIRSLFLSVMEVGLWVEEDKGVEGSKDLLVVEVGEDVGLKVGENVGVQVGEDVGVDVGEGLVLRWR